MPLPSVLLRFDVPLSLAGAGLVHGGFAATVLDTVTGCATHTVLPAGES